MEKRHLQKVICQKSSKYQTQRSFTTLSKTPNDGTGALKGGTLSDFSTSILSQNIKKLKRGQIEDIKNFQKISHSAKKLKLLVSPRIVRCAETEQLLDEFLGPNGSL